jgi:NitT/TauT family transport system permease protein
MSNVQVQRPEFVREGGTSAFGVVEKPLTLWEKTYNNASFRKGILLVLLAAVWQAYATALGNPLLFPKFSNTFAAFYDGIKSGVLLQGYAAGMLLAALLTAFAITSRIGNDFLETLTAMFNPLPAIALLPLALIWFGFGWFIYENKNLLEIANVFAGLFSVIIIGLVVENFIFRNIELKTVRKWGMQS